MLFRTLRKCGSMAMAGALALCAAASVAAGVMMAPMPDVEAKTYKIVLDPGHCASHTGAHYGSLKEETLTLKVAKYAKAELEQYKNVKVYMTRTGAACPHTSTAAPSDDNYKRCVYANNVGADAYISIHMNSAGTNTANGCEVYYQQRKTSKYNAACAKKSKKIAEKIQKNLVGLGLVNRGIKYRVTESGTTYPDGGLADYYAVIKYNRLNNIPAVIVEHAFIDGGSDYKFLSKTSNLKKLGIADAQGVAEQFGLTKIEAGKISSVKATGFNGLKVTWGKLSGATGYQVYRSTTADGTYTQVGETASAATTTYTDNTCTPGVKYFYKFCGKDSTATGAMSAAVSATAPASKVSTTTVTAGEFNQVTASWEKVANATGYFVYRKKASAKSFSKIGTTKASVLTYTDNTAACGETYTYKVCAYRTYDKKNYIGAGKTVDIQLDKRLVDVSATVTRGDQVSVSWTKCSGATGYKIYRKAVGGTYGGPIQTIADPDTLLWADEASKYDGDYLYTVRPYRVYEKKAYLGALGDGVSVTLNTGNKKPEETSAATPAQTADTTASSSKTVTSTEGLHPILGRSSVTADQMIKYYESKVGASTYPSSVYTSKGAGTLKAFVNIVVSESESEGVLPELVFGQICQETGYLRFGGQVKASQCNFAGLGATNGGAAGAAFANVREGVRAQVQHLKLYANASQTKTGYKNACVDQRFSASLAGKAPYIEWLDMRNNPNNTANALYYGWALTDDGSDYGAILLNHINKIKAMK